MAYEYLGNFIFIEFAAEEIKHFSEFLYFYFYFYFQNGTRFLLGVRDLFVTE